MENQRTERKLAAILAADVVGYSRLMSHDEEGTLRLLKAHLGEIVEPHIAAHRGRIVKRTGDGLLVDFASAVEAVRCAVAIQAGMADRNRAAMDDSRIEFRIGINLGDVIIEGDDIYGSNRWPIRAVSSCRARYVIRCATSSGSCSRTWARNR
jgi:adenylate cyclase